MFLCFSSLTLSSEPRKPEVEALINIKNGLHDPHGALNNWDEFSVDPCSWAMITHSLAPPTTSSLASPSQSLSGTLSESIGNLTNLRQVSLQSNNISGKIPPEIGLLPKLQTLDLSNNRFSDEIPVSVEQLSSLQYLSSSPDICSGTISSSPLSVSLSSSSGGRSNKLVIALGTKKEEGLQGLGNLRSFTFRELHVSTDGFSSKNMLGAGGFGNVYRGNLGEGAMVAVKRLKDVNGTTGDSQFRTELEMISLAVHRNLLRLIGYCKTSSERLLVYPYMPNGSVALKLKSKPELDWTMRKKIAIGAARGLLYLHEQCDPKIIHRDVKAANILLDECFEAVVGDFGLVKLLNHEDSHVTTALEFGKTASQKGAILEWVGKMHEEMKVEELVDRELGKNYNKIEVGEMMQVALLCTQYLPAHRPKMSEVVLMLEGDGLA
ncbi:hypothetical protein F2Q69_00033138 [Brassica cretica]|uniref:non-specific serine/threonine protein kinase n=1 Tax=Brassica cretica TaxID=69181 RepID=A0A8S9SNM6_BRACR|nr:hypothetical protein F2Q69_00033138 [Brassica cretica]